MMKPESFPRRRYASVWRLLLLLFGVALTSHASAASLYSIGNSLTNDLYADGLQAYAADSHVSLQADYHIRSSASMTYIVANPEDVTLSRPGPFTTALLAQMPYDFVSLEPYNGIGSPTYGSEVEAIADVVDMSLAAHPQARTVFYLYAAWPNQSDTAGNYSVWWNQKGSFSAASTFVATRACYDQMLRDLRARFGRRATFRVIPTGDIFAAIDRRARNGRLPGITDLSMLYRDTYHMGEVGRFVAASSVIATLFKRRPRAQSALELYQFNDGAASLTPTLARTLEDLVWSTVANDPRSGVQSGAGF